MERNEIRRGAYLIGGLQPAVAKIDGQLVRSELFYSNAQRPAPCASLAEIGARMEDIRKRLEAIRVVMKVGKGKQ